MNFLAIAAGVGVLTLAVITALYWLVLQGLERRIASDDVSLHLDVAKAILIVTSMAGVGGLLIAAFDSPVWVTVVYVIGADVFSAFCIFWMVDTKHFISQMKQPMKPKKTDATH